MARYRFCRGVNVELKRGTCHLREFAVLAIIEDGILVVRYDPLLQFIHCPLLIDVDAFRDLVREGRRGVRAWGTATRLLPVLCAIQAVLSICGSGPGCWEVCVQQSELLASLSAHVHAGDVLTHVRELLGGVCVTLCIFALELYHYSSYYT